jgi:hypothetical protein
LIFLPSPHLRRYLIATAVVVAAMAFALAALPWAQARDGLLRNRAVAGQAAGDLVRRGVEQKIRCAEDCLVSGQLVLSSDDGDQLRTNGLQPRLRVHIARLRNLRLEGERWYRVRLVLTPRATRAVRRAEGRLRLTSRNLAVSLESGRYERSTWVLELQPGRD